MRVPVAAVCVLAAFQSFNHVSGQTAVAVSQIGDLNMASVTTATPEDDGVFSSIGRWFGRRSDSVRATFAAHPTHGAPQGLSILTSMPESEFDGCPLLVWAPLEFQDVPLHAVILVHGLDEPGNIWDDLAPHLYRAGHAVVRFDYPNDQGLAESGSLLADALRELMARGTREVSFVGHSMGGLVIREALTGYEGYGGVLAGRYDLPEVGRVITVATPNGGSEFARFRGVLEVRERLGRVLDHDEPDWFDLFRNPDGDGQAGKDLTPGSEFLATLATRPCPEGLRHTAIISRWVSPAGTRIEKFINGENMRSLLGARRADQWLSGLEAKSNMLGDGVVSMDSGCAADASDTVILSGDHRSLLSRRNILDSVPLFSCDADRPEVPVAIPVIVERLNADALMAAGAK